MPSKTFHAVDAKVAISSGRRKSYGITRTSAAPRLTHSSDTFSKAVSDSLVPRTMQAARELGYRKIAVAGGVALAKALRLMAAGELPPEVPQDEKYATHVKKLRKTDGLIVWDTPVIEIERRIRAYNPWPGCYTFLPERFRKKGNSGRLVVTKAKIIKKMEPGWTDVEPGRILKADKLGPIIRCHDTALQLLEVKPEGSSLMTGGAFLSGRPLKAMEDFL